MATMYAKDRARSKSRKVYRSSLKNSKKTVAKKFANFVGKVTYKVAGARNKVRNSYKKTYNKYKKSYNNYKTKRKMSKRMKKTSYPKRKTYSMRRR
jgi:hypothetical protein